MTTPSIVKHNGTVDENNIPYGCGTTWYSDGSKYFGFWNNGLYEGRGTLFKPPNMEFAGDWKEGQLVTGDVTRKRSYLYSGEWKNMMYHGKGLSFIHTEINGVLFAFAEYEGEWKEGKRHGIGIEYGTDKNGFVVKKAKSIWVEGTKEKDIALYETYTEAFEAKKYKNRLRYLCWEFCNGSLCYKGAMQNGCYDWGIMPVDKNTVLTCYWHHNRPWSGTEWVTEQKENFALVKLNNIRDGEISTKHCASIKESTQWKSGRKVAEYQHVWYLPTCQISNC